MPSYRIQYVLDDLDNPDPLVARTDLILAANVSIAERTAKSELVMSPEQALATLERDIADGSQQSDQTVRSRQ